MRINREALTESLFTPAPLDFAVTGLVIIVAALGLLLGAIGVFSQRSLLSQLPTIAILFSAILIFVMLEIWLVTAYEQMMLPLRIVEAERALLSGAYTRAHVHSQSAWRRSLGQYWARTASPQPESQPPAPLARALTGHRGPDAFEGYLIEIPRRPFLFRRFLVLPLTVLEPS